MFDHSAVKWSPSIFTRYSLPVVADFHTSGIAVDFAADFVAPCWGAVCVEADSRRAGVRIPHTRMTTGQDSFNLKGSSSVSSASMRASESYFVSLCL